MMHCTREIWHFGFSNIKNMLKDHRLKTRGLQFDKWFFEPEMFSELSRNRPLIATNISCFVLCLLNVGAKHKCNFQVYIEIHSSC